MLCFQMGNLALVNVISLRDGLKGQENEGVFSVK